MAIAGLELTFSPGENQKNVTVFITDDDIGESSERFCARLSEVSGGSASIFAPTVTITIDDDDSKECL